MIFFKALVENQREGNGNILTRCNENDVWKTVQTIAFIGVNVANEKRLDQEKGKAGDGRRNEAGYIGQTTKVQREH